ncbi:hypothetical protein H6P81_009910 [Aristolochia fimbriata]|uniref:Uncharacterized protein n=1 Tax=Aristolochia fimbriata TaxID=158543 RepID=A0AAV7EMB5_ARIFI|nr:hypothetical protein H6P81_009910 [Aristolochia fimbriata]
MRVSQISYQSKQSLSLLGFSDFLSGTCHLTLTSPPKTEIYQPEKNIIPTLFQKLSPGKGRKSEKHETTTLPRLHSIYFKTPQYQCCIFANSFGPSRCTRVQRRKPSNWTSSLLNVTEIPKLERLPSVKRFQCRTQRFRLFFFSFSIREGKPSDLPPPLTLQVVLFSPFFLIIAAAAALKHRLVVQTIGSPPPGTLKCTAGCSGERRRFQLPVRAPRNLKSRYQPLVVGI